MLHVQFAAISRAITRVRVDYSANLNVMVNVLDFVKSGWVFRYRRFLCTMRPGR